MVNGRFFFFAVTRLTPFFSIGFFFFAFVFIHNRIIYFFHKTWIKVAFGKYLPTSFCGIAPVNLMRFGSVCVLF